MVVVVSGGVVSVVVVSGGAVVVVVVSGGAVVVVVVSGGAVVVVVVSFGFVVVVVVCFGFVVVVVVCFGLVVVVVVVGGGGKKKIGGAVVVVVGCGGFVVVVVLGEVFPTGMIGKTAVSGAVWTLGDVVLVVFFAAVLVETAVLAVVGTVAGLAVVEVEGGGGINGSCAPVDVVTSPLVC